MFEAGFFGTLEDLFLGAKGGIENIGYKVEETFLNLDSSNSINSEESKEKNADYKSDERKFKSFTEEIEKTENTKGIRDNLMEYVVCNYDLLRLLDDGVSIKSGEDSPRVENISITIDIQKMIWNYLCKRPDEAVADSTEKTDNSGKMLLDKLNDQSSEIKKQFQDALVKAKTAALEEIHCLKEMAAFAKKKSEGRLTQADSEELERKLPVWKKCLLKAKCDVVDTFLTEDAESDNSGMEKTEITFEDFEEALHYVKEQISSL